MGCVNTKESYQYPKQSYPLKQRFKSKDQIMTENQTFQIVKNPIFKRRKDQQNQKLGHQDAKLKQL